MAERLSIGETAPTCGLAATGEPAFLASPGREYLRVIDLAKDLLTCLARLDVDGMDVDGAVRAAPLIGRVVKAAGFAHAALVARAAGGGAHKDAGFASPGEWLAHQSGSSVSEARAALGLAGALEHMPRANEPMRSGELSLTQAGLLAKAEAVCPGAGDSLVDLARRSERSALKEAVRETIGQGIGREELFASRRNARSFCSWVDELGMSCIKAALPPDVGQALVARVEALARSKKRGSPEENFSALAADAFAEVCLAGATPHPVSAEVVFVVSYDAYRPGHLHPGEPAHLVGAGPVSLHEIAAAVPDAFIKALVHKGKDVYRLAHLGRRMPAELRSALLLGPPPDFAGAQCAHPGCGRRYGLELDHSVPISEGGPTSYANLQALCRPHHWQKTESDRAAATKPWAGPSRDKPKSKSTAVTAPAEQQAANRQTTTQMVHPSSPLPFEGPVASAGVADRLPAEGGGDRNHDNVQPWVRRHR